MQTVGGIQDLEYTEKFPCTFYRKYIFRLGDIFTSPFVTAEKAVACGKITLVNDKIHDENLILNCYLYDSESSLVEKQERNVLIYKGSKREIDISFQIENPCNCGIYIREICILLQ